MARGIGGTLPGRVLIVWNVTIPLGVRALVRPVGREGSGVPQRGKDDPTSQCRWPKGDRKPGRVSTPSSMVLDNWPDTG